MHATDRHAGRQVGAGVSGGVCAARTLDDPFDLADLGAVALVIERSRAAGHCRVGQESGLLGLSLGALDQPAYGRLQRLLGCGLRYRVVDLLEKALGDVAVGL